MLCFQLVLDHETWIFDMDEANRVGEPQWRKSYTMKKEFGMNSLLPSDWDILYNRLRTEPEIFDLFYKCVYHCFIVVFSSLDFNKYVSIGTYPKNPDFFLFSDITQKSLRYRRSAPQINARKATSARSVRVHCMETLNKPINQANQFSMSSTQTKPDFSVWTRRNFQNRFVATSGEKLKSRTKTTQYRNLERFLLAYTAAVWSRVRLTNQLLKTVQHSSG